MVIGFLIAPLKQTYAETVQYSVESKSARTIIVRHCAAMTYISMEYHGQADTHVGMKTSHVAEAEIPTSYWRSAYPKTKNRAAAKPN